MSDTEKVPVPSVDDKEPKKTLTTVTCVLWSVAFYAGAVTAALVCVCVYGAIYKPTAEMPATKDVRHYHDDSGDGNEDYDLDVGRNREIINKISADGNMTLLVLDFKENTGGMYSSQLPFCVMVEDFGGDIPDALELQRQLEKTNDKAGGEINYSIDQSSPVDLSRLPPELIKPCWGKELYMLAKDDQVQGARRRRDVTVSATLTVRVGFVKLSVTVSVTIKTP